MHHENRLKLTTMSEKHLPNTYQDWCRRSERLQQLGLGLGRRKYPYGFWPRVEGQPPAGLSTEESKKWVEDYKASHASEVGSRHSLQSAGSRSLQSLHSSGNSAELTTKERALLRLLIKTHGQVQTDSPDAQRLERHLSTCLEESSTFKTMLFHDDKFAVKVMDGARELVEQRRGRSKKAASDAGGSAA
jgi:hypothetical protein